MNFFALVEEIGTVKTARIPVEQDLQNELTTLFNAQEQSFFANDPDEVPFSPSHTPDSSEIAYIDNVIIPKVIVESVAVPLQQDQLKLTGKTVPKIKAIFGGESDTKGQRILFQAFERRQILDASGLWLIPSRSTYKRLKSPGLMIDTRLSAVYRDERLYFHSFFTARRVLDLSSYYREATDDDLKKFAKEETVALESPTTLLDNADEWVRRRVALIRDSKVMKNVAPQKIATEGKRYGLKIRTKKIDGQDRILFPDDKKELKTLLRFLEENYYTSGLTGDRFVANSKRPIK